MKIKGTRKIVHIMNEINLYLLEKNATRIINELVEDDDKITLYACGKVALNENELANIQQMLEAHHEYEYEEYYSLVGEGFHCDELPLLGSMIDLGEVKYEDGVLIIHIERNK